MPAEPVNMDRTRFALLYVGILFVSLSSLVFEISLTKIFSVTLWYHFAYLVVSLALFGIGGGGIVNFVVQDRLRKTDADLILRNAACLIALTMIICLYAVSNSSFAVGLSLSVRSMLALGLVYLLCSMPFFLIGFAVSFLFKNYSDRVTRVYCFDLLGAACGCIAFLWAISHFSGPTVVLICSGLACIAALCFQLSREEPRSWGRFAAFLLLIVALVVIGSSMDLFSIKHTKSYKEREDILFEKWSPLARITVYPKPFFTRDPDDPFGWSFSKSFVPRQPVRQLWIEQDASAGMPITHFDGDFAKVVHLKYDFTSLPYHLKRYQNIFIVGVGGGKDVLTALAFGNRNINGCDISPVIVDLVRTRFREFSGNLYHLPQVHIEVAEARNFIRRSPLEYDLIQIPMTDSWAATVAGAFSLSENNLYTVEAFIDYFDHLTDDGILAVSRYLFYPRNQSLRVASLGRAALEKIGIENVGDHVVVISTRERSGGATLLFKKRAFTGDEIARALEVASDYGFVALYVPGHEGDRDFERILTAGSLDEAVGDYYYDIRPPTDDRPFFFQMTYFHKVFDLFSDRLEKLSGQAFNYLAHAVVLSLLVIGAVLAFLFYFLPLRLSKKCELLSKEWGFYFLLIGLGFMFIEIPVIQRGTLYLGHPTYSFTVVLFSMLLSGGIGSLASGALSEKNLSRGLLYFLCAIIVATLFSSTIMRVVMPHSIGWPFSARVALMIAMTGVMAFPMGAALPLGIKLCSRTTTVSIPWFWAINGTASVLGSILAMITAMTLGYQATFSAGMAAYLGAAVFYAAWLGSGKHG